MATEDRFIISRVNTLAHQCANDLADYQLHRVVRELLTFVLEDLSRWYIQLVRPRMWLEGEDEGKRDAYQTLYYVLRRLFALLAPFAPHLAEACYRNLRLEADPASVHMLAWPEGNPDLVDPVLERATALVRSFDDAVQNARQAGRRKLRWPVRTVTVVTDADEVEDALLSQLSVCPLPRERPRGRGRPRRLGADRLAGRARDEGARARVRPQRPRRQEPRRGGRRHGPEGRARTGRDGRARRLHARRDPVRLSTSRCPRASSPRRWTTARSTSTSPSTTSSKARAGAASWSGGSRRCAGRLDLAVEDLIEVEVVLRDSRIAALVVRLARDGRGRGPGRDPHASWTWGEMASTSRTTR